MDTGDSPFDQTQPIPNPVPLGGDPGRVGALFVTTVILCLLAVCAAIYMFAHHPRRVAAHANPVTISP